MHTRWRGRGRRGRRRGVGGDLDVVEVQAGRAARDLAPTLLALVAEIARTYLPWVSRACADGAADVAFADGTRVRIAATPFLQDARATLLARYVALRSPDLDTALAAAGALPFFADWVHAAGREPDHRDPPRPALNRPFPPAEG